MRSDPLAAALLREHPEKQTGVAEPIQTPVIVHAKPKVRPRDVMDVTTRPITMEDIFKAVIKASAHSAHGHITVREIKSARRHRYVVHWRQIVFALAKKHTELSLPLIGRLVGKRDHSTVIHGVKRVENEPEKYAFDLAQAEKWL